MNLQFRKRRLGDILLSAKAITDDQLGEALRYQREKGGKVGEAFMELGILTEDIIIKALSEQLNIPVVTLKGKEIRQELFQLVGEETIRQHRAVPFYMDEVELKVAVSNPLDIDLEDKLYDLAEGLMVSFYLATTSEIENTINRLNPNDSMEGLADFEDELYGKIKIDLNEESKNPVINISNQFFKDASALGASDIHIDPYEDKVVVKLRIDGVMRKYKEFPKSLHNPLVIRIKNSAGLDFTKTNIPQDGRTTITVQGGREIDLRIATLPTTNGEKVTIRLLDKTSLILDLTKVGFNPTVYEQFSNLIKKKAGIILVTGETGSGKSSLCYAILSNLNTGLGNILTVEDPVEYELEGVSQVHINEKAGLTFATTLRSFLRHDPNIIFVGEIRDYETAEIAVRASITGHLVIATIHTNSSAGTIARLVDMGMERHLVAEAVCGIINQRLVNANCPECSVQYEWKVTDDIKQLFNVEEETVMLTKGKGCDYCNHTGYKGRVPVQELLVMNNELGELIKNNVTRMDIEKLAKQSGFMTFKEDGWEKTKMGRISIDKLKGDILYG